MSERSFLPLVNGFYTSGRLMAQLRRPRSCREVSWRMTSIYKGFQPDDDRAGAQRNWVCLAQMMTELGLNTREEHYFDLVPWQSLAAMNHNFLLTERRRHYLRYAGGLTFFEVRMWLV